MSSTRRSASEINILAMLDRQEAGGLRQRLMRGLRGSPAMLRYGAAGLLVLGLVGTLAWLARDQAALSAADAALAGAAASLPAPEAKTDTGPAAAPEMLDHPAPAAGATIVDMAPETPEARDTPAAAGAPDAPRIHAAPARTAPRTAALKGPAAGARAPALAHAEAQRRRAAAAPKPAPGSAPAGVDTDVALISAIIQHASRRQEAEDAARKP